MQRRPTTTNGMLSFTLSFLAAVATLNILLPLTRSTSLRMEPHSLHVITPKLLATPGHEYFRPSGDQVSGFPTNNVAQYHRSPCPALNSLANHGYIPRNGKALTPEMLHQALMEVYNLDDGLASRFTGVLPPQFTLANLSVHGFIEHDASLVHDDAFFKADPSQVNETLATALLATNDGKALTKYSLAHFRSRREAECKRDDPQYSFSGKAQVAAYGEAALLLLGLGDYESSTISVPHARSFLVEERIPADFCQDGKPLSTTTLLYLAGQIKVLASFS